MGNYQSFEGDDGVSKSEQKLRAIQLPEDLTGMSVLDIGCNEGFFCKAALERRATRVVGIDKTEKLIDSARQRVPGAEFRTCSWWDLPAEKFDVILFLSAIHYEPEQKKLLNFLSHRLNPAGLLVLEGGIAMDWGRDDWRLVQRHDAPMRFPSISVLTDQLLSSYAVRAVGRSVQQLGDPMKRFVLHCKLKQPTIMVIGGQPNSGKSIFARQFAAHGVRTIHTDPIIGSLKNNPYGFKGELVNFVKENMTGSSVKQITDKIIKKEKEELLVPFLLRYLSKDDDITVIEGYVFAYESARNKFRKAAIKMGFRVIFADMASE